MIALMMDPVRISEMSINFYQTARYIPESYVVHTRLRESLKSYKQKKLLRKKYGQRVIVSFYLPNQTRLTLHHHSVVGINRRFRGTYCLHHYSDA
jgi:hypothetical protein